MREAQLSLLTWIVLIVILVNSCSAAYDAKQARDSAEQQLKIMQALAQEVMPNDRLSKPGQ